MSKGLLSYPEHRRASIALRRAKNQMLTDAPKGNGYWAAIAYLNKFGIRVPVKAEKK